MKELWLNIGKNLDLYKTQLTTAIESGVSVIIANAKDLQNIKELGKIKLASNCKDADILVVDKPLKVKGKETALFLTINCVKDQDIALKALEHVDYLIVTTNDWKIIPLENLIAAKKTTKLIAKVFKISEAKTVLETLEAGVDGILIDIKSDIRKYKQIITKMSEQRIILKEAIISSIKPLSMGDRVCIDTCSLLKHGQGMLIGSQSNILFFVHSESLEGRYVEPRPFRVNAGPVHSYILMSNGKTRYLSELKAGQEVSIVDVNGVVTTAVIGRIKIEKRPLLLIEAKIGEKRFSTILQNAETIRLVNPQKKAVSITTLKAGDKVLVYSEEGGRHFGMKVQESIKEL